MENEGNGAESQVEDNNLPDSPTGEENQTDDSLDDGSKPADDQKGEPKEDGRLDKHPRFKEVIQKVKQLEKENAELRQQKPEPQAEVQKPVQPSQDARDREIEQMFADAPKPQIRSDYKTYEELYSDFRKEMLKDINYIQDRTRQQEKEASEAKYNEFNQSLRKIEKILGDESQFELFKNYLGSVYSDEDLKDADLDINTLFAVFLSNVKDQDWGQPENPNKVAAKKISKSAKPVSQGGKGLNHLDIHNKSFSEIAESLI